MKMCFIITSPAFADGSEIPQRYSCDDEDISPPLDCMPPGLNQPDKDTLLKNLLGRYQR